jgi:thymidylate synthase (FAD)
MIKIVKPEVRLINHIGWETCAKAARVCTESSTIEEIMTTSEKDEQILKRVVGYGHLAITEFSYFVFAISGISRTLTHQLVRKRIASYAQQSMRYTSQSGEYKIIVPESMMDKKVRVDSPYVDKEYAQWTMNLSLEEFAGMANQFYEGMQEQNVPNEDARFGLLEASHTQIFVAMNGHALLDFFNERCCTSAQWEIRTIANQMLKIVKIVEPMLFESSGPKCLKNSFCHEAKKKWNGCKRSPHISEFKEKDEIIKVLQDEIDRLKRGID